MPKPKAEIDVPAILAARLARALNFAIGVTAKEHYSEAFKKSAGLDVTYAERAARDEGLNPDNLVMLKRGIYYPTPRGTQ